jgi:hypothetical protein
VVLADRIKKVQDSHLLELIQEVVDQGRRIPPAAAAIPFARAAAVAANAPEAHKGPLPAHQPGNGGRPILPIFPEHHSEQEDYLWGV